MGDRRIGTTRLLAGATIAIVLVLGGCGGGNNGAAGGGGGGGGQITIPSGGEPEPERTDVAIQNFRFEPEEHTVSVGDTVWWVNEGSATHTVTSDTFDSGSVRTDHGFAHTFEEAGEYAYWCKNHPGMEGTIIVE